MNTPCPFSKTAQLHWGARTKLLTQFWIMPSVLPYQVAAICQFWVVSYWVCLAKAVGFWLLSCPIGRLCMLCPSHRFFIFCARVVGSFPCFSWPGLWALLSLFGPTVVFLSCCRSPYGLYSWSPYREVTQLCRTPSHCTYPLYSLLKINTITY